MISRILIIASGGLLCYSKNLIGESSVDDDLVSGFLTAISNFAKEIKGGEIRNLNFRNFNFIYAYDTDLDCMFILVINIDDLEEEARVKVELLKDEFIKRYRPALTNWTGDVTQFKDFDAFVEDEIFIPPKVLLVGEDGVGKTTILNLFPGETVLQLDEDLNEIIQKPINVTGLKGLKQFVLRELDMEDLIDNSKIYRQLLDNVDIICVVTNSAASNLGRTKKHFERLRGIAKKPEYFMIANFQDLKDQAFDPTKIEEAFAIKTFPFSATKDGAKEELFTIFVELLKISIIDKLEMEQAEE